MNKNENHIPFWKFQVVKNTNQNWWRSPKSYDTINHIDNIFVSCSKDLKSFNLIIQEDKKKLLTLKLYIFKGTPNLLCMKKVRETISNLWNAFDGII